MGIYYWPYLGRSAGAVRMCDAAGIVLPHISDKDKVMKVVSARGQSYEQATTDPTTDVFAPPILYDGDMLLSQSVAIQLYLGEKLGFDKGIPSTAKAVQHMADLNDFLGEVFDNFYDMAAMRKFNEERFGAWVGCLDRSITGPFFYGTSVTYVDFYFLMVIDWVHKIVYDALEYKTGDLFLPYARITSLRALLHRQPWYALQPESIITNDHYMTPPERAATY